MSYDKEYSNCTQVTFRFGDSRLIDQFEYFCKEAFTIKGLHVKSKFVHNKRTGLYSDNKTVNRKNQIF